jgi:CBS domain-containing protein
LSSIFFDLRLIHGDETLFEDLHKTVLEKCRKNRIFQAYMAANALTHRPPIGFFRNIVLIHGGDHDHTMDLKHNGIVPIVDLARVYALAGGITAVNTFDRLEAAREAKVLSNDGAEDLRDALEFISMVRLHHQASRIRAGVPADNFVPPEELSSFDRSHLKSAFGVVKTMQAALSGSYQLGRF